MSASHPNRDQLSGYTLGTLPEKDAEVLAEHLEICPECEDTLRSLENTSDTLVKGLRGQPNRDRFQSEAEYRRAVALLNQLEPEEPFLMPAFLQAFGSKSLSEPVAANTAAPISVERLVQALVELDLMTAEEVPEPL